jgi:hypothetical protein
VAKAAYSGGNGGSYAEAPEVAELREILEREYAATGDRFRGRYFTDLLESADAIARCVLGGIQHGQDDAWATSCQGIARVAGELDSRWRSLVEALGDGDVTHRWLALADLWPCITKISVLEQLRSTSGTMFDSRMRDAVVSIGVSITHLQQHLRIKDAIVRLDTKRMADELENPGHTNWSPSTMPDWLLLEIDSNISIRPDQVEVAWATIRPGSGTNSVLQVNMGKGKTSCIVPMAIAALANGKELCRHVVPKELLAQTAQVIQAKLCGLVGRKLSHVPFSRATLNQVDMSDAGSYVRMHHKAMQARGVILTTPEHLLSIKMGDLQKLVEECGPPTTPTGGGRLSTFSQRSRTTSPTSLACFHTASRLCHGRVADFLSSIF